MKKILLLLLLVSSFTFAQDNRGYRLSLSENNGNLSLECQDARSHPRYAQQLSTYPTLWCRAEVTRGRFNLNQSKLRYSVENRQHSFGNISMLSGRFGALSQGDATEFLLVALEARHGQRFRLLYGERSVELIFR